MLASLRSSKDEGQSNFVNPGIWLVGIGADFDVLPQLRLSLNWNSLWFDDTAVLEVARNQGIDRLGHRAGRVGVADVSPDDDAERRAAHFVRAGCLAGDGFKALYPGRRPRLFHVQPDSDVLKGSRDETVATR